MDVGFRNYVLLIKSKQLEYQNTCLILFLKRIIYTVLFHQIILQHFTAELMYISNSFFPYTKLEWNELDKIIQQCKTIKSFRNSLLKIGWPTPKPVYNIHIFAGLKLLGRLRLRLSHLNEHKFNHNFRDCVNLLCPFSLVVESSSYFFLHCHYHIDIHKTLFHELQLVDETILNQSDNEIVELLLYSIKKFNFQQNCSL